MPLQEVALPPVTCPADPQPLPLFLEGYPHPHAIMGSIPSCLCSITNTCFLSVPPFTPSCKQRRNFRHQSTGGSDLRPSCSSKYYTMKELFTWIALPRWNVFHLPIRNQSPSLFILNFYDLYVFPIDTQLLIAICPLRNMYDWCQNPNVVHGSDSVLEVHTTITDEQLLLLKARRFFTLRLNMALIQALAGEPLRFWCETDALCFFAFYGHNHVGMGNRKEVHFFPQMPIELKSSLQFKTMSVINLYFQKEDWAQKFDFQFFGDPPKWKNN